MIDVVKRFLSTYCRYLAKGYPENSPEHRTLMHRSRHTDDLVCCTTPALLDHVLSVLFDPKPYRTTTRSALLVLGRATLCLGDAADEREEWAFIEGWCRFIKNHNLDVTPYTRPRVRRADTDIDLDDANDVHSEVEAAVSAGLLARYTTWDTRAALWSLVTVRIGARESTCVPILHHMAPLIHQIHTGHDTTTAILALIQSSGFIPFYAAQDIVRIYLAVARECYDLVQFWTVSGFTAVDVVDGSTGGRILLLECLASLVAHESPAHRQAWIRDRHDAVSIPVLREFFGCGELPPDKGRRLGCLLKALSGTLGLVVEYDGARLLAGVRDVCAALQCAALRGRAWISSL
jgi:hypothetical protein